MASSSLDRRLWIALGALSFLGGDCGPSTEEAGGAVLMASPLVFLAGLAILWSLFALWRRRHFELRMERRPALRALGVLAVLAALGLAVSGSKGAEWIMFALWLFGSSYLALMLVTFRIWFQYDQAGAFKWAPIPPMVLLALPALVLLGSGSNPAEDVTFVWILPGYMGVVPGVLYPALLLEAAIRGRRREA